MAKAPRRYFPPIHVRFPKLKTGFVGVCIFFLLQTQGLAASRDNYRLGQPRKWSSISFSVGSSLISGDRAGIGANEFTAISNSDSLYKSPRHLVFEYAEHNQRTTLALGLEYIRITASNNLRNELGLTDVSTLTVGYLDLPFTYRINTFEAGRSALNISAGVSLIAMLDIAVSSSAVFKSGESSSSATETTVTSGELANKHIDLGLGFGGEIEIERRVANSLFLTASAGFRHPFSGVTRPDLGYFLAGLRIYSM